MVNPLTVVIKLGSSSILQPDPPHFPQIATLSALAETCVALRALGHRVVIVSSGAVGMGLHRMELPSLPGGKKRAIGEKQALAAIGQGRLIALWDQIFGALKQPIAQILMTRNDIADRSRYLNATTTLSTLLSLGVIPIINENDTISVSEILHINKFGDNDTLSAIAAGMCGADYLFLMTDVDGLYEDNPRRVPGARRVRKVRDIEEVRRMVSTSTLGSSLGTGGMETKLIAAELATAAGCATVITLGSMPARILTIVQSHAARTVPSSPLLHPTVSPTTDADGVTPPREPSPSVLPGVEFDPPAPQSSSPAATTDESHPPYTLFTPKIAPLSSRRFWILHGLTPRGTVFVDEGAYRALTRGERDGGGSGNGGRLLAAGVIRVEGAFAAGQAVRVCVLRKKGRGAAGALKEQQQLDERERARSRERATGAPSTAAGTSATRSGDVEDRPRTLSRASSPDHFADRRQYGSRADPEGPEAQWLAEDIEAMRVGEGSPAPAPAPSTPAPATADAAEEEVIEFGRGLSNYNSVEIDRVKGHRR
ncbi:hypothetical protein JCM8202_005612 [Rhodotorula sphaerocarpa]